MTLNRSGKQLPASPRQVEWEKVPHRFCLSPSEPRDTYEVRRRLSDRRVFLCVGFAIGWGASLLLGPALKGLVQGFLLGLV